MSGSGVRMPHFYLRDPWSHMITRAPRVFLSYWINDQAAAREIARCLRGLEIDTWLDVEARTVLRHAAPPLLTALAGADSVVVLLSPKTLERAWVQAEVAESHKRYCPVAALRLEPCAVPPWIGARIIFDMCPDQRAAIDRLATWLRRVVENQPRNA